jgi:uncharacterized protein (DUF4415 family)
MAYTTQPGTKKSGESSALVKQRSTNGGHMKRKTSNRLTARQKTQLEALAALPDEQINTDDIPEVQDWNGAKRGLFYRPIKQQITLRLDADLIDWFKNNHPQDEGYQTSINRALREYVTQHQS